MNQNTTISAARKVANDEARDRLSLEAATLNLINKAVEIGGHPEISADHVRAMQIIRAALDSIAPPPVPGFKQEPIPEFQQARAAGVQAVGEALGVAAE